MGPYLQIPILKTKRQSLFGVWRYGPVDFLDRARFVGVIVIVIFDGFLLLAI
jgi:hypothetical protein